MTISSPGPEPIDISELCRTRYALVGPFDRVLMRVPFEAKPGVMVHDGDSVAWDRTDGEEMLTVVRGGNFELPRVR